MDHILICACCLTYKYNLIVTAKYTKVVINLVVYFFAGSRIKGPEERSSEKTLFVLKHLIMIFGFSSYTIQRSATNQLYNSI